MNLGGLIYVGERPWQGLGTHYETPPKDSIEIVEKANLDWTVCNEQVYTSPYGVVPNYHAIYRQDNNDFLGVVHTPRPNLVQNIDTFKTFDHMMNNSVDFETASIIGRGEGIFGVFKVRDKFKVIDDDIDHYFVVINDHLKPDGKVMILNTPIRVVCQNALSHAISQNFYKFRIPITSDVGVNQDLAEKMITCCERSINQLTNRAEAMLKQKVSRDHMKKILTELFPYTPGGSEKANMSVDIARETFLSQCMSAPDLSNYAGTAYQVFNALTDYTQHYFKKVDNAYDLTHRMKTLPGVGTDTEPNKVAKFLKIKDKLLETA